MVNRRRNGFLMVQNPPVSLRLVICFLVALANNEEKVYSSSTPVPHVVEPPKNQTLCKPFSLEWTLVVLLKPFLMLTIFPIKSLRRQVT